MRTRTPTCAAARALSALTLTSRYKTGPGSLARAFTGSTRDLVEAQQSFPDT
jgi:hypothetical protein